MAPLIGELKAAREPAEGSAAQTLGDGQIVLIPLDARLYYVQTLLYPDGLPGTPSPETKAYVAYAYERGDKLHWSWQVVGRNTQEVRTRVRLVAELDGDFLLIEAQDGLGGAGSADYHELITQAVEPLEALGARAAEVETTLERILGFASGLDWDESLEPSRQLALLQWALASPYWADRVQAAEEIFRRGAGAKETIPALVTALGDEDDYVRGKVVAALVAAEHGEQASIPALLQAMEDESEYKRAGAADALGAVGGSPDPASPHAQSIAQALIQGLADESALVRGQAASGLGRMGPQDGVIAALIQALEDEDSGVRIRAAGSLRIVTGQDLGQDAQRWREWWSEQE